MTRQSPKLPDWVEEKEAAIHILAGMERVAYKMPWDDFWMVKSSRCSQCGLCCQTVACSLLTEDNLCSLGTERPFRCCVTEPKNIPECTSLYTKVKI